MSLTRYERGVIEDSLNKVIKQQKAIDFLEDEIKRLNIAIENLGGDKFLSIEEQSDALEAAVKRIIKKLPVKLHTHLSDQEGGDAFANKGAKLIQETI